MMKLEQLFLKNKKPQLQHILLFEDVLGNVCYTGFDQPGYDIP